MKISFLKCLWRDYWCQGAIEDDEEPKLAAIKKLREETGVASAEIIAEALIYYSACLLLFCDLYVIHDTC